MRDFVPEDQFNSLLDQVNALIDENKRLELKVALARREERDRCLAIALKHNAFGVAQDIMTEATNDE